MTRKDHLRRVAILCRHCFRNLAFYNASKGKDSSIFKGFFWANVHDNFLDICVLEWCKLFGDLANGKHCWRKVISNPEVFYSGLLKELNMVDEEFKAFIKEMKDYRDKYIAHLDLVEELSMNYPRLDITKQSVLYLYNYLLEQEDEGDFFNDMRKDSSKVYDAFLKIGMAAYEPVKL